MNDASPTHPAQLPRDKLLADCQVRRTRRSGPGGQHRNKVETAVVITHLPTGVIAEANERRSQRDNHVRAVFRLRVKLAIATRGAANSRPSELWQSRCRAGRIAVNPEHDDFPTLLAEALDVLESFGADVSAAAAMLAVTPSQFIKLLALEPAALDRVNAARIAQGFHAWK